MTFPEFLRAEVLRLGDGVASRGEILAGIALGYSPRKVRAWYSSELPHPTPAEVQGAMAILPKCGPLSERDKRLRRKPKPSVSAPPS